MGHDPVMRGSALIAALSLTLVPASAAAHEFVAYFEPGSSLLSPAAYRMVRSAAAYAADPKVVRVRITAHLDTLEGDTYSDELGLIRAQSLATELVSLGIDPGLIELETQGDSQLARPTPDGTAEPLNRRAIISMWWGRP
jgi:outer membrane protein OmpA-like peptidoglycan-associated protein